MNYKPYYYGERLHGSGNNYDTTTLYSSEYEEADVAPPSPTESDYSLSLSFSSAATTEFVQFLSDIGFTSAGVPPEMVPTFFMYSIAREDATPPLDIFEEPREASVPLKRMRRSYLDWVEYGIPLSRFLFAEHWISRRVALGWDKLEMRQYEEARDWRNRFVLIKKGLDARRRERGKQSEPWSSSRVGVRSTTSARTSCSSVRFAPVLDDDRQQSGLSKTDYKFGRAGHTRAEYVEGSSVNWRVKSHSPRDECVTLAREYRRRFGGTWNVVQMAGGAIPRYVEEMQANIMRKMRRGHLRSKSS